MLQTIGIFFSGLLLAIDLHDDAIGGIGIIPLKDVYKQTAEIVYWLAEPFWGKGIAAGSVTASGKKGIG